MFAGHLTQTHDGEELTSSHGSLIIDPRRCCTSLVVIAITRTPILSAERYIGLDHVVS